jgi:hypothetical protein
VARLDAINQARLIANQQRIQAETQKVLASQASAEEKKLAIEQAYLNQSNAEYVNYIAQRTAIADKFKDDEVRRLAELDALEQTFSAKQIQGEIVKNEAIQRLDLQAAQSRVELATLTASSIGSIAQGLQAVGLLSAKKAFAVSKAVDSSQAITAGILATQRALSMPPSPNFALAGLTAAAAAGNVAKILATPFGGKSMGSVDTPRVSGVSEAVASSSSVSVVPSGSIASSVGSMVSGTMASAKQTFVVETNVDRAGFATFVREGNDEISSRGISVGGS